MRYQITCRSDSYSSIATTVSASGTKVQQNQQEHSTRINWLHENDKNMACYIINWKICATKNDGGTG